MTVKQGLLSTDISVVMLITAAGKNAPELPAIGYCINVYDHSVKRLPVTVEERGRHGNGSGLHVSGLESCHVGWQ